MNCVIFVRAIPPWLPLDDGGPHVDDGGPHVDDGGPHVDDGGPHVDDGGGHGGTAPTVIAV
jgi:hypothetical protein